MFGAHSVLSLRVPSAVLSTIYVHVSERDMVLYVEYLDFGEVHPIVAAALQETTAACNISLHGSCCKDDNYCYCTA